METTVVQCKQVEESQGLYCHTFDFPSEWDAEERLLLTGIWLSDTDRVQTFEFWYHNLHIQIQQYNNRLFDGFDGHHTNQLSKFMVPVIVDTRFISQVCLECSADCEINDMTITFQWSPMMPDIHGDDSETIMYTLRSDCSFNSSGSSHSKYASRQIDLPPSVCLGWRRKDVRTATGLCRAG